MLDSVEARELGTALGRAGRKIPKHGERKRREGEGEEEEGVRAQARGQGGGRGGGVDGER